MSNIATLLAEKPGRLPEQRLRFYRLSEPVQARAYDPDEDRLVGVGPRWEFVVASTVTHRYGTETAVFPATERCTMARASGAIVQPIYTDDVDLVFASIGVSVQG